ncbi:MAG: CofH family radical SAM protein [Thermodesulfobacteriota bacterium]
MPLPDIIQSRDLKSIARKVEEDRPISSADALTLLTASDILDLGAMAHHIRTRMHGRTTYYGVNRNLNYTNICELRCPLCAFSKDPGEEGAYLLSLDEIEKTVSRAVTDGLDEIHIVGGLHPDVTLDYAEEMIRTVRRVGPGLFIVAFTAVEYDYFAQKSGLPVEQVLKRLIAAGVNSLPGGGAEIFSPDIRSRIAPKKISGDRWLEVMRTAHHLGLKTNATMLYNHVESSGNIADHLLRIRKLQDETGGFKTFVPLRFHGANTGVREKRTVSGYDDIRVYATARIVLHNIPHIKGLWMYLGDKIAQVMQHFGVDDIGGTYHQEKVVHAAGAATPDYGSEPFLRRLIENAGFEPKRATAGYSS